MVTAEVKQLKKEAGRTSRATLWD